MKTVIAKKDFYLGDRRTLQKGKEYRVVEETTNGIVIKNDFGKKQGFSKQSDWVEIQ